MSDVDVDGSGSQRNLRLWPAVAIVLLAGALRFAVPVLAPEVGPIGVIGGLVGGLLVGLWWVFWSRAPKRERYGVALFVLAALAATYLLLDPSMASGAMGLLFPMLAVPGLAAGFVLWAVATRRSRPAPRRIALVVVVLATCMPWALIRTGGFTGDFDNDLAWRWSETPEERMLAAEAEPDATEGEGNESRLTLSLPERAPEWPGFRGAARNGVVTGSSIATDWESTPPVPLWRRPIGPAWSSFAVHGSVFYTQEQRGDEETVGCYDLASGDVLWRHGDPVRFWESNAGAGPRATPTLSGGRVYTFGATGLLNALDARTGAVLWSRDVAADTGTEVPGWAFSSSPLVEGELVLIAAAGTLAAYDANSGESRWVEAIGGTGYSSPHVAELGGVRQVLLQNSTGVLSVDPTDGRVLWRHDNPGEPIVQPGFAPDGGLLIHAGDLAPLRRIRVAMEAGGWQTEEVWKSSRLKPNYNDFAVHGGYAFGFDGSMLACIDLESGARQWKGGRYGHGQLLLLADQDLLLVLAEEGDLALVRASAEEFEELARVPGIEGKTWNHPVLVDGVLLVRNGEEMAAFRLNDGAQGQVRPAGMPPG